MMFVINVIYMLYFKELKIYLIFLFVVILYILLKFKKLLRFQ